MSTYAEAKAMAKSLRDSLAAQSVSFSQPPGCSAVRFHLR
jgi:hypothetical protein